LRAEGFECIEKPQADGTEIAALLADVDVDVLVVRSTTVTAEAIAASATLSLIVRAGAGFNNVDVVAASARGIYVCNTPGRNAVAVAELTIGLMIALDRQVVDAAADLRRGHWDKPRYSNARGLKSRSLGIVGLGRIGMAVAQRAAGFGMRLHAVRRPGRDPRTHERIEELNITLHENLVDMAAQCDVLTLHLAGTEQIVDASVLAAMPPGSILLNTARAGLVDDDALIAAMDSKGIRAGLDVFEDEPDSAEASFDSRLVQHPNVVATPHIGASTEQAQEAVASAIVKVVAAYAAGRATNCVNLETGRVGSHVIVVRHEDRVGVLAAILGVLRRHDLNVAGMENRVFRDSTAAVASMDLSGMLTPETRADIADLPHVYHVDIRPVPAIDPAAGDPGPTDRAGLRDSRQAGAAL
jgi:D-3-phosphoglycerate dehydrogenase